MESRQGVDRKKVLPGLISDAFCCIVPYISTIFDIAVFLPSGLVWGVGTGRLDNQRVERRYSLVSDP